MRDDEQYSINDLIGRAAIHAGSVDVVIIPSEPGDYMRDLTSLALHLWVPEKQIEPFVAAIRARELVPHELIQRNRFNLGDPDSTTCVRLRTTAREQVTAIAQEAGYGDIWAAAEVAAEMRRERG